MWGQDLVRSPLEREAASAGITGGSEEQQQPCWARETKFTLSCSFKTIAGQGGGWMPPILALELGHRSTGPARGGGHSTRAHCPWQGTRPSLKNKGIMLKAVLGVAGHGRLPCEGPVEEAEPRAPLEAGTGNVSQSHSSASEPWKDKGPELGAPHHWATLSATAHH